jgi:hypothetical protein
MSGLVNFEFLKNMFNAFIYGVALSSIYEIFTIIYKENEIINIYKKNSRIILRQKQNLTKEDIIRIGREAIRCKISNEILEEPVVGKDGISYNKSAVFLQNNLDKIYENRSLKEFIQRLKIANKAI